MKGSNRECPVLYLVVPCYNEEAIILESARVMKEKISELIQAGTIDKNSKVLFVNDGSKDKTFALLSEAARKDDSFIVVSLVGNAGHQNAIWAGMMTASKADVVITIDADLQQDINAVADFLECYRNGAEVVYGVRNNRESDGTFKKLSALAYYKFMHLMGSRILKNHADYRLISRKVIDALKEYNESNLFLRGLIPSLGFPSDIVYFDTKERIGGETKYTLSKMLKLATDGITSFTIRPLRIISFAGFITMLFSIILIIFSFIEWLQGKNVPGYTTLLLVTLFMSGIILLSLGVIGEYLGKIYLETKSRPKYLIDCVISAAKEAEDDD
ncbi:MAG: glycosyltransferase family 2 protein [Lachnospiraceae bacterium]|nr:glycosyltransferase family 2 protein [Lachnospiraceae bacterium]